MLNPPLLEGIRATVVETPRLRTQVLVRDPGVGEPVILVHGNTATSRAFEELMLALPSRYHVLAPDLRGYGRSEPKPVDATRGMRDFSDDLYALVQTLGLRKPHLAGWSLGGCVIMQYAIDHPAEVASLTLMATGSPYGFGCTRDAAGTITSPDFAGSGGGLVNPEILRRFQAGDRSADSPFSPRNRINNTWFKAPFRSPREDILVDELLLTVVGDDNYPGDSVPVQTWPGVGPGTRGVASALSPKYCNLSALAQIEPRPPILWVRGDADRLVSDTSLLDPGFLGQIGLLPGWPGPEIFPPQPMIAQTRLMLEQYAANGGSYREVVLQDCGHSPHIEHPEEFNAAFFSLLEEAAS